MKWLNGYSVTTLFLILAGADASTVSGVEPSPSELPTVYWALYDTPCTPTSESTRRIDAGDFGVFYFDGKPFEGCPTANRGSERTRIYASPGPAPHGVDCDPVDGCATSLSALRDPWIAIVDWDNWHGRIVDKVIRFTTDLQVQTKLFGLESVIPGSPGITDVDVIASLATIAEAIDSGVPAPELINMSFGRFVELGDATTNSCHPERLSCQISRLLTHLERPAGSLQRRTTIVAAAGNHQKALFPAILDHVLSVGSLDMALFAANGTAQPSWETPSIGSFPRALMPGAGHCVNVADSGMPIETIAPAGTSFAAGIFSGWLTDALLHKPRKVLAQLDDRSATWVPRSTCPSVGSCLIELAHGSTTFTGRSERAYQQMLRLLNDDPTTCGTARAGLTSISADLVTVLPAESPFRYPSGTTAAAFFKPAPEPDPCVPCTLCCEIAPSTSPLAKRAAQPPVPSRRALDVLEIDLHNGWTVPTGTEVKALYFRLPLGLFKLDLSPAALSDFRNGNIGWLTVRGSVLSSFDYGLQPTLIALLEYVDPVTGNTQIFWDSTPLLPQ